ncbi:Glutamine transport ATP-binding protein GlnQ [Hartmannibacter diazotrophicus]|uniref:Glutamine transport ATP-binding protein GlnQ n=1 Tax=Hartmannibacter diazotrophicus TaxID=1482074 RepID=A0A2C9D534_9HYPH|nr:ABC transporter ATP-binding protein [Hartmannibacter diazotrophicus]SON55452.1 Glutamine transport ATP-binding protein GlnQ [Hartmannibacter diazotrophicus]
MNAPIKQTEMRDNVVLHVADVHKTFGGLHALADIDLAIEEGKTHAIIGPNGAGKSTLLNVIVGRLAPTRGAVVFDGKVLTGMAPYQINQVGIARVFQTPEIFPDLSVLQNVMAPAFAKRDGAFRLNALTSFDSEKAIREEAEHLIEDVNLTARKHSHAGSLSRGDKRRMELAMCLIQHPRLLLLDEPTAGMSRADTNATVDLLKKIKERGMTKIIIEHDMHVVFSLADKISVLAQGRIICEGLPDEVRGDPRVQEAYLGGTHV